MPYNSIGDLPVSVRRKYTVRCQKVFLRVWNTTYNKDRAEF